MNEAARIAYIECQRVCALIELESMRAANYQRERNGDAHAYGEESFMALIDRYAISHNAVIEYLGH